VPGSPLRQRLWGHWRGAGHFSGVSTCVSVCTTCTRSSVQPAVTAVTLVCEPSSHHNRHPSRQSAAPPATVKLGTLPSLIEDANGLRDYRCLHQGLTLCRRLPQRLHPSQKRRGGLRSTSDAIHPVDELPEDLKHFAEKNAAFYTK
jgi:hypothetical protein